MPTGQQPPLGAAPKAHVVALAWIAIDLLLVGKVLLPAKQH